MLKKLKKILMTETAFGYVYMIITAIKKISGDDFPNRDCFF